jgi:predicted nucleotidyltransferase component of viral defense system
MKSYRETYIRKAEIAQLILLHQLYLQKESRNLIFQGGTAIRWCYGGSRFSEDLDFVTSLDAAAIKSVVNGAIKGVAKLMIPHFGIGAVSVQEKSARVSALKCFVDFRPEGVREKISIKLEFEGLETDKKPDFQNHILSSMSAVAYLIAIGEFRVPRANTVIVAETPAEILSDKVRSLLERPYLKGRDFFDLWYLHTILKTEVSADNVKRKFSLYRANFTAKRGLDFYAKPSGKEKEIMREAIEQDLSRFLPPDVLSVHRARKYAAFLEAVSSVFADLQQKGMRLP